MKSSYILVYIILHFITVISPAYSQENINREDFYSFLEDYIGNLHSANMVGDSSLSPQTNLELRVRKWNDYISAVLPARYLVVVPVEEVSVGREKYNRSEVQIDYSFQVKFPQLNFRFENNVSNPEGSFKLDKHQEEVEGSKWIILIPRLQKLLVQSNLARKFDILRNHGNLLFKIQLNYSREGGWTHFYHTVITFNSIRWEVDNETVWQLESLPFNEIMLHNKKD